MAWGPQGLSIIDLPTIDRSTIFYMQGYNFYTTCSGLGLALDIWRVILSFLDIVEYTQSSVHGASDFGCFFLAGCNKGALNPLALGLKKTKKKQQGVNLQS